MPGDGDVPGAGGTPAGDARGLPRRIAGWLATAVASVLVIAALVGPNELPKLSAAAFVRIPVEGLLGIALLLLLPPRLRRVATVLAGIVLGLLTIMKIVDMGFYAVLDRPFDLVLDWVLFDDGIAFLTDTVGRAGAIGAVVAAAALAATILLVLTLSVVRLTRLAVRYSSAASPAVAVLTVVWFTCVALGAQLVPGVPIASRGAASLVHGREIQVHAGLVDQQDFTAASRVDKFRDTPGKDLLTGLRGKDVIFSFVESYGRSAVEDPQFAPQVDAVLDAGTKRLNAAGFSSRSAYLTSSTSGSGSWLAHATFMSGLWVTNQQRYRSVTSSDRLTLTSAFKRANWRTVGVEPGTTYAWPEAAFYGYDRVYNAHQLGYHGPAFSWSTMPDQYSLAAFDRAEYATPGRAPMMAEITLTSSHAPWSPTPKMVDWKDVGDGRIFGPMATKGAPANSILSRRPARVRADYRKSIEYTLDSLISYVEKYGNDNLVLVFLGDHQPAPLVVGSGASRDVPVTIVAHDKAVLDRMSGWGWQDGLNPGSNAPVWRMDAFRDRFLTTFSK